MSANRIKYALFTAAVLLLTRAVNMFPVFRGSLIEYLNINDQIFGLMLSIESFGGLFTVLAGGALVDKYGPRRVLRITLAGTAFSFCFISVLGKSWISLVAALAMLGLCSRPLNLAVNSYLVRLFPKNQRRVLSLNLAGTSAGSFLFPFIAELLLKTHKLIPALSFAVVFHLPMAIIGVLVFIASFFYRKLPAFGKPKDSQRKWHWKDMFLPASSMYIIGLMVLHAVGDTSLFLWMPRFLESDSFTKMVIGPGYVISGRAIAFLVSRSILAVCPERFGKKSFLFLPGLFGGVTIIVGILSHDYLILTVSYITGSFFWSAEHPAMMSILAYKHPNKFGAALAMFFMLVSIAVFLMMNIMGMWINNIPGSAMWKVMLLPASLFPCIGFLSIIWYLFNKKSEYFKK
jgi:MFS family permease